MVHDLIENILIAAGSALVAEPIINQRWGDFTDTNRIHHAQVGALLIIIGGTFKADRWLEEKGLL